MDILHPTGGAGARRSGSELRRARRAHTCSLARATWFPNWIRWRLRTGAWEGTRSHRWCRIRSTGSLPTRRPRPTTSLRSSSTGCCGPMSAYTSVGGYRASRNIANSIYHAMTIKYEKRFSRGLSVVAHYTISKMLSDSDVSGSDVNFIAGDSSIQDYFNLRNERSLSAFDVPQRLVVSFDYQLPVGRGPDVRQGNEPDPGRRDRRLGGERDYLGRFAYAAAASRNRQARCGSAASVPTRSAIRPCRERCATS